jgi:hypothetical protein
MYYVQTIVRRCTKLWIKVRLVKIQLNSSSLSEVFHIVDNIRNVHTVHIILLRKSLKATKPERINLGNGYVLKWAKVKRGYK